MIRLHHIAGSRSSRILWLLCEMGLEVELVHLSITDGSLRQKDYLARSPAGRVPALKTRSPISFPPPGRSPNTGAKRGRNTGLVARRGTPKGRPIWNGSTTPKPWRT